MQSGLIQQILAEAGRYGKVTVKRIYGDWTSNSMRSWKEKLNTHAIRPIQKFSYTTGKNSTDSALIIDAMDLLHYKHVDGFCIVSSDSDYTGIAHRIREEGLFVMGIGRSHTPEAFVKACENFTFSEILMPVDPKEEKELIREATEPIKIEASQSETDAGPNRKKAKKIESTPKALKQEAPKAVGKIDLNLIGSLKGSGVKSIDYNQIDAAFRMVVNEDTGQALLSEFGQALRRMDSTFDPRNFGFSSFRKFTESLAPNFQLIRHKDGTTLSLKKKD